MSLVARPSACSVGLRLTALFTVALGASSCAPQFNFKTLRANGNSDQGEVLISSPDQDGTKISYAAENGVWVSGTCTAPGWTISVSGDASGTTTCQTNGTWSVTLNFSSAPDGNVSFSVEQSNGSEQSAPAIRSFTKDTAFCEANSSGSPYAGGSGTSGSPYLICSTAQLLHLSNTSSDWGKYFQLRNDIDLEGQTWTPVNLSGTFDGNGFVIKNLSISLPTTDYVALFGGPSGIIKNLGVVNASVSGHADAAILAGQDYGGKITNCYTTGTVTGAAWHIGALVGQGNATITNSWSSATVTGGANGVGGLVGHNYGGAISNSYFTGTVHGGWSWTGGIVGVNDTGGVITNSYSTGAVIGAGGGIAGGLVGLNNASIVTSFATGAVSGMAPLGGLDGSTTGTSSDSYWDIGTTGQSASGDGLGLTDAQMQDQANYTGFDFTTPAWTWKSYLSAYPVLEFQ